MTTKTRSLILGFGVISIFFIGAIIVWAGATFAPGLVGETFRFIAGILGTPVLMEISIGMIGTILLFFVLALQREKEGDDYMTIEVDEEETDSDDVSK